MADQTFVHFSNEILKIFLKSNHLKIFIARTGFHPQGLTMPQRTSIIATKLENWRSLKIEKKFLKNLDYYYISQTLILLPRVINSIF